MRPSESQVMCLELGSVYPDAEVAASVFGCEPREVLDACLGHSERAGGYSWAIVADGWVLALEESPERRLVRKWTVEDHRRIVEAGARLEGRRHVAQSGDLTDTGCEGGSSDGEVAGPA